MPARGYFYRVNRKVSFLLKRGSLFRSSSNITGSSRQPQTSKSSVLFPLIFINSLFSFLLAYVLVYLIFNLSVVLASTAFNVPTLLSYAEISYIVKGTGWSSDAVKIIFSSGPFLMFLLGVVMLYLYQYVSHETGLLKMLVLWIFSFSVVQFLGEIMVGSLLTKGFGYVLLYLYVNDTMVLVITVLALAAMVVVGTVFTRLFLVSANSYFSNLPHRWNRKFLRYQMIFPFIAGNLVIYTIKLPGITLYELCVNATMIFLILPVYIRAGTMADFYFDEEPRKAQLFTPIILISIIMLALFRLALNTGIRILM